VLIHLQDKDGSIIPSGSFLPIATLNEAYFFISEIKKRGCGFSLADFG